MSTEEAMSIPGAMAGERRPWWRQVGRRVPTPVKTRLFGLYWYLVEMREHLAEYSIELIGNVPVHGVRMFWLKQVMRLDIGQYSSIHRACRIYRPDRVHIGKRTVINYGILLDGRSGLSIGDNASISEGVVILTLGHDIDSPDFALQGGPVSIGDYVFIGSYARVLPGVTIGEGAVVAVGAVVTHDVAPYEVVGGVPARFIRMRSRNLTYQQHHQKPLG